MTLHANDRTGTTMQDDRPVIVSIKCLVFNHRPYIRQCLDGFVMQKADFRFEAVVHDDASTDGTADIIREYAARYPDIIRPILETENRHSKHDGSLARIVNAQLRGKYTAMCEGDDYWTDPYKLQKQVDFMEAHPDYSMCHGDVWIYNEAKRKFKGRKSLYCGLANRRQAASGEDMFRRILTGRHLVQTLTVLYRNSCRSAAPPNRHGFMMGDTPLWLDLSQQGKIKYFDDCFGVYRQHEGSATRNAATRLRFTLSMYEMRAYYCEKYHCDIPKSIKRRYNEAYREMETAGRDIIPEPIYPVFKINRAYDFFMKLYEKRKFYYKMYVRLHPLARKISLFAEKMTLFGKVLANLLLAPCRTGRMRASAKRGCDGNRTRAGQPENGI